MKNENDLIYLKKKEIDDFDLFGKRIVREIRKKIKENGKEEELKEFLQDDFFYSLFFSSELLNINLYLKKSLKKFLKNSNLTRKGSKEVLTSFHLENFLDDVIIKYRNE